MRQKNVRACAYLAALFLLFTHFSPRTFALAANGPAASAQAAPEISYVVSMPRPHVHLLQVEMRLRWRGQAPPRADLVMPTWTPGSYLIREYARHVQDFAAREGGGRALPWTKVNKNTWRVESAGAREVVVRYDVYSNELTVRTNELNDRHAFWNNAALLMHPAGQIAAPSTLRVEPFGQWKIATGLPQVSGQRNTFSAPNYDVLYDSPFLVSDFKEVTFDVRGVRHRIVVDGPGNYDLERMRRDVQKVVEETSGFFADLPYENYTFMLMTHPTARGGLEHLNSTALIWRRFGFRPEADYRDFLSLVTHEYFHIWNVKLIRPDALGPFDYTNENYTRLLWVAEGVTSYYDNLLPRRAGLMTPKDYLEIVASSIQTLQGVPGRLRMSVEEASFDAWIEYYRPDENTINQAVSYYDKGAIVSLLLDMEIRRASNGARSLDDVMRALYADFGRRNRNYTPEDFQRTAERVAGTSLDDFFRRYVRGREELDYDRALAVVGLRLDTTGTSDEGGRPAAQEAFLGATLAQEGDRLTVTNVPSGTPAYEQGLNARDQIVAVDGFRATRDFLNARLKEKRPGDSVAVTVFRNEELRTINVRLGGRAGGNYRIVPVNAPNAEQARNHRSWLGAPHPKAANAE